MEPKEIVWAKMKRFAPWPGVVTKIPPAYMLKSNNKTKNSKCIFFFGTKNFAWVENNSCRPYVSNHDKPTYYKQQQLRDAVRQCDEYISDPIQYKSNAEPDPQNDRERDADAEFNKLREDDGNTDHEVSQSDAIVDSTENTPKNRVVPIKTTASSTKAVRKLPSSANKGRASLPFKFKVGKKNTRDTDTAANGSDNVDLQPSKRSRMSDSIEPTDDDEVEPDDDLIRANMDIHNHGTTVAIGKKAGSLAAGHASHKRSVYPTASSSSASGSSRRNVDPASVLISRHVIDVEQPTGIDLNKTSPAVEARNIKPSKLRFGFLGLGTMGGGMVKSLINSGHTVYVYNRTYEKCQQFEQAGAKPVPTPADLIDKVDITFSCVSTPTAAKEMVFGNCGVLSAETLSEGKGYVEMTGMDDVTSGDICDAILSKGGRYMETQIQGSKKAAEEGELVLMSAGDRTLFDECITCFEAMAASSFYLGNVGNATKMYMVLQVMAGINLAGLAEAMALAQKVGLDQKDVLRVLGDSRTTANVAFEKATSMFSSDFAPRQQLGHMQKDLMYALGMSEIVEQPLPMAAAANEVFKHAKRSGYAEHDACAVYAKSIL